MRFITFLIICQILVLSIVGRVLKKRKFKTKTKAKDVRQWQLLNCNSVPACRTAFEGLVVVPRTVINGVQTVNTADSVLTRSQNVPFAGNNRQSPGAVAYIPNDFANIQVYDGVVGNGKDTENTDNHTERQLLAQVLLDHPGAIAGRTILIHTRNSPCVTWELIQGNYQNRGCSAFDANFAQNNACVLFVYYTAKASFPLNYLQANYLNFRNCLFQNAGAYVAADSENLIKAFANRRFHNIGGEGASDNNEDETIGSIDANFVFNLAPATNALRDRIIGIVNRLTDMTFHASQMWTEMRNFNTDIILVHLDRLIERRAFFYNQQFGIANVIEFIQLR